MSKNGFRARILSFALALPALISSAWAADYHSPRAMALAGSGHAGPLLNDAIQLNPSFAAFLPTYGIALNWLNYTGPVYTNPDGIPTRYYGRNYNLSIQDGRSQIFQAGASYTVRQDGTFIHVGAARSLIKRTGFGIGGKIFFSPDRRSTGKDLVFSSTGILSDWLQTALIIDNLLESTEGKARGMYREFILGFKLNLQGILLLYFDPHTAPNAPEGAWGFEGGTEFVLFNDFFLRLGTFRNSVVPFEGARGRGFGYGIGWVAPRLSLDFGVSRVIEPRSAVAYSLGATVYF